MGRAVPNIDLPISHGAAAPGYSALPVSPETSPRLLQVCQSVLVPYSVHVYNRD